MNENSTATTSSSKRAKKNPGTESNEMLKLQLDSEKSLHEVQCFVEELFATSKSCPRGPVLNTFVDPVVNLNIDLLLHKIRSSASNDHAEMLQLPGSLETLLQKLSAENEILRRNETIFKVNESLLQKKVFATALDPKALKKIVLYDAQ